MPIHYGQIDNYPAHNNYQLIDNPVPEEELCTLLIDDTLTLRSLDGPGRIGSYGVKHTAGGYSLRIAAGTRTLGFSYFDTSSTTSGEWITTTTYTANDIGTSYDFEPGRIYSVFPMVSNASVTIEISETSFPVQLGWRMGPYLGWQQGITAKTPIAGLFALGQAGLVVTAGDISMEFLGEVNAGFGYSPFKNI
jgi:hypothetical protein